MPNSQPKCWQASGRAGEDKIKSIRLSPGSSWLLPCKATGMRQWHNRLLPTPPPPHLFLNVSKNRAAFIVLPRQRWCKERLKKMLKRKKKKKGEILALKNSASSYNVQKSKRINKGFFFFHLISCTPEAFVKRSEILLFIEFLIWSLLKGSTHVWFSLSFFYFLTCMDIKIKGQEWTMVVWFQCFYNMCEDSDIACI